MNFHDFDRLVKETRTVRRFRSEMKVETKILHDLIDLTRFTPSSKNMQPLKYVPVNEPNACEQLFSCLSWAKALKGWQGPSESERPGGYIIILGDTEVRSSFSCDHGITAMTMHLGARASGLGSCIIASIDRKKAAMLLDIASRYEILLVLALGAPGEEVRIVPLPENGDIDYFRDENDVHCVLKRSLDDIIVKEFTLIQG